MTNVTLHAGVNEIGGNKFLLEDKGTKIFLDFGMSFSAISRYFDFPTVDAANIDDLLKTNVIPHIPGLYRNSHGQPFVDAIVLSHAHVDHSGHLPLIRKEIPIYAGRYTSKLLQIRSKTMGRSWDTSLDHLHFKDIRTGKDAEVKDLSMRPFRVDHSVPGAHAFLIKTSAGNVVYTGDLRISGYKKSFTEEFLKEMRKISVKCLLCEGTNVSSKEEQQSLHKLSTEDEVNNKVNGILSKAEGLVIYDGSPVDFDRVRTVWKAAKKHGRRLVMISKLAFMLLETVRTDLIKDLPEKDDFLIYLARKKLRSRDLDIYEEAGMEGRSLHEKLMTEDTSLRSLFVHGPKGREKILKTPDEYLIYTTDGVSTMLQFKPSDKPLQGSYIYGKAEPFNEEMEISFERLRNWVELCGLKLEFAHTSGHASKQDIIRIIREVSPEILIPIHTEYPHLFGTFVRGASKVSVATPGALIKLR